MSKSNLPAKCSKGKLKISKGMVDIRSVKKVCRIWFAYFEEDLNQLQISNDEFYNMAVKTIEFYHHCIKYHGIDAGTKWYRTVRTYYINHVLGKASAVPIGLSTSRSGFPRKLSHLRKLSKVKYLRISTSLLNLTRLSVESDGKHNNLRSVRLKVQREKEFYEFLQTFDGFCSQIFKYLNLKPTTDIKVKLYRSSNNGPNSSITKVDATFSSIHDALALKKDKSLFLSFKKLANNLSCMGLVYHIDLINKQYSNLYTEDLCHSKISVLKTPENKQRTVALIDYYSQTLLSSFVPVIDKLQDKLSNNFMYDQDKGRQLVRSWTTSDCRPISLDSSDFTDRFPWELQNIVMKHLTSEEISNNFFSLLKSRGFKAQGFNRKVWYGAGQPMGAQASFQIANATHSLLAIFCSTRNNQNKNNILSKNAIFKAINSSAVVGDDIVFKYNSHGRIYKNIMVNLFKMDLSPTKGFTSTKTSKTAEFCKRTYHNGMLVSGLSPRPTLNLANDYKHISSFQSNLGLTDEELLAFVDKIYTNKRKEISDLLFAKKLIKDPDLSVFRSTSISDDLHIVGDYLYDLPHTEITINSILKYVLFLNFFVICLQIARGIEEVNFSSFIQGYSNESEGSESPSSFYPISLEKTELTPVQSSDICKSCPPMVDIDLTQDTWPVWVYGFKAIALDTIYSNPKIAESYSYVNTDITSLIVSSRMYREAIDELKQDLFGSDSYSFDTSPFGESLRVDWRKAKENDKKLFLLSTRTLKFIRSINFEDKRISFQFGENPPIEIEL